MGCICHMFDCICYQIFSLTRTFGWPMAILVLAPAEGWKGPSGPAGNLCPLSSVLCPQSVHCIITLYSTLYYFTVIQPYAPHTSLGPMASLDYARTYCSHSQSVWNIMEEVGVDTLAENMSFRNQNLTHKVSCNLPCLSGKVLAFCL